jgi:DNA-binding NtrC family response regulator
VRELENAIRRAVIMARSENRDIIRSGDLPPEVAQQSIPRISSEMYKPLEEQILEALRSFKFSRSAIVETAKALGNRDRGTITEYFRGICFEELVNAGFDIENAAKSVAGISEDKVVEKVRKKMEGYLNNLYPLPEISSAAEEVDTASFSQFKGLPKKYHPYLLQIIAYFREKQ